MSEKEQLCLHSNSRYELLVENNLIDWGEENWIRTKSRGDVLKCALSVMVWTNGIVTNAVYPSMHMQVPAKVVRGQKFPWNWS